MILKHILATNVGPIPSLDIEFRKRLNVFTGDNGLGKTFILDTIWWSLTGSWAGMPLQPSLLERSDASINCGVEFTHQGKLDIGEIHSQFSSYSQEWELQRTHSDAPVIVIYARVDGSFSIYDSIRNYSTGKPRSIEDATSQPVSQWTTKGFDAFHMTPEQVWNGLRSPEQVSCNGLIEDWVKWQWMPADEGISPFRTLQDVLLALSPPKEPIRPGKPMRVSMRDSRTVPSLELSYGQVPITRASAGIKRILSLAYLLVWAWAEHLQASRFRGVDQTTEIIFLIDEPESHLHPKWQRAIIPALFEATKDLKPSYFQQSQGIEDSPDTVQAQIVTTTHAPLVLASLEPYFDSVRDRLFLFEILDQPNAGRTIELDEMPWILEGSTEGWLTSRIFGLAEARSIQAEAIMDMAQRYMSGERDGLPTRQEIEAELKNTIPGLDPFWIDWRVSIRLEDEAKETVSSKSKQVNQVKKKPRPRKKT